jgi:hypothetical protein
VSIPLGLLLLGVDLPGTSSVSVALAPPSSCRTCHGTFDPAESAFDTWAGSAMGHAARDPLFLSALTEAEKDAPGIGDLCLRCHAPEAWLQGRCLPSDGSLLLPDDSGITCSVCHRMDRSPWQRNGQYLVGEDIDYRGPYDDAIAPHRVQRSDFIGQSELCGACHDLRNPLVERRDLDGTPMGMPFPEQTTYTEWAASAFAFEQSCQDCHMPEGPGPVADGGPVRPDRSRHDLSGGNVFLLRAIDFLEPGLGLGDQLNLGQTRAIAMLRSAATLEERDPPAEVRRGEPVAIRLRVTNESGHKLPTGYPEGRRVWLELTSPELALRLGRFDTSSGEPIDPVAIYRSVQGQIGIGPGHRLALNDAIFEDTRIPPRGFVASATTAPVGKVYPEVSPGVLAHFDDVTVTATVPCDEARTEISILATLWYQSVTKRYVDRLVSDNAGDPRGARLALAFEEADPGPIEMASLARTIPIARDSTCAPPDAGFLDAGNSGDPDAGDGGPPGPADAGMITPPPDDGCGCTAAGAGGSDGLALAGLLVLSIGASMRTRTFLTLLMVLSACTGEGDDGDDLVTLPRIDTESLPDVRLGATYAGKIAASLGTPPYVFSIESGALPTGIELEPDGAVAGIAAQPGRASFTAAVTDAKQMKATKALTLYVIPDPLEIVTTVIPSGKEGDAYDQALVARGGVTPYTWTLDGGTLPMGLEIVTSGRVMGTPSEYGDFDFTVKVTDAEGTARLQMLHLFLVSLNPVIETSTVPKAREGEPYSTTLEAEGGVPPYAWTLSAGSLPVGIQLANDGSLSGVPAESGDFTFSARVADSRQNEDEVALDLRVIAPLQITTPAIPQVLIGRTIDFSMAATGGEPPYVWSITGTLPVGVTFEPSGRISGSSNDVGLYSVTIRVTDSEGFRDSGLFDLRVSDQFTYEVEPLVTFPPACGSSTFASSILVPIEVTDSMQVDDVDVGVTLTYAFNGGAPAPNDELKLELFAPGLAAQTPLCGDGAGVPGGLTCNGQGGIDRIYDDDGPFVNRPEQPLAPMTQRGLAAFDGLNALGTWYLRVAVADPQCNRSGVVERVVLLIRDDRDPSDYVVVRGLTRNNLITAPWVRITTGNDRGLDQHDIFLSATVYSVGPNGFREGGAGDDIADMVPLTWMISGSLVPGLSVTSDGHVRAGAITGATTITASGGGHVVNVPLYVTPPDWNPLVRIP